MSPSWKLPTSVLFKYAATDLRPLRTACDSAQTGTCSRKAGPRGKTGIHACHSSCSEVELPGRFVIRGMNDDLAFFADAHTLRANSGNILQRQMDDAALARGHGIQPEGLARTLHALRGHARRHA